MNKLKHIRYYNSNITICGIKIDKIRCRPRYGFCNLESNHKSHHDASAHMANTMIEIADDDDPNDALCPICLVDSY